MTHIQTHMTLKLELFVFQLRKITHTTETLRTDGGVQRRHKAEKSPCLFSDVYKSITSRTDKSDICGFMKLFIDNFCQSFKVNSDKTMALSLPEESNYCSFNSAEDYFYGHFLAGPTGAKSVLFDTTDALTQKGTIRKDSVPTRPYFFKIWLPKDVNYGAIILQSTTSATYNVLFLKELSECFINFGYKMTIGRFYTKKVRDAFFRNCILNDLKISYANTHRPSSFKSKLISVDSLSRVMFIKNLCISLADIVSSSNYMADITEAISELDRNFNPKTDSVQLFCSTTEGQRANAALDAIENFFPPIILSSEFYDLANDIPCWDKLHQKTSELLREIQSEYSYFPKQINL